MDWGNFAGTLLTSTPAIVLYAAIAAFAWSWAKRHWNLQERWDTERWEGMVLTAFNLAERHGGSNKLAFALVEFGRQYAKVHGHAPSTEDVRDAALDFARYAYELKLAKAGQ